MLKITLGRIDARSMGVSHGTRWSNGLKEEYVAVRGPFGTYATAALR